MTGAGAEIKDKGGAGVGAENKLIGSAALGKNAAFQV